MQNKYQHGKIYKISDIDNNKCYYGSTIKPLRLRFILHKHDYNRVKNGTLRRYTACDLFDEYQFNNCKIELVEIFPCSSKEELLEREGYYIKNNDCINKIIAGSMKYHYYKDNTIAIREYHKQYYKDNKDRILKRMKERYRALTTLKQK